MQSKQTDLFKPVKVPTLTKDEKSYQWLCKQHLAGFNGKYDLYSKKHLYKLIQWDMLYGNHSAETKEYLIKLMKHIQLSHYLYYHVKSLTKIIGYNKWLLNQIYQTEQNKQS